MSKVNSYPSVYQVGHKAINGLFDNEVVIEEKIDGSQFSFGLIGGELCCRSKGKEIFLDAAEGMFQKAVDTIKELQPILTPEWIYRAEYLGKPKHNTICYARVPVKNLIVYDIQTGIETYLSPEDKHKEIARLGLEYPPLLFQGKVADYEMFKTFLERESCLGGSKVEGVVVKNYSLFTQEKKVAMGKYVSEDFREKNEGEWRKSNPTTKDIVALLIEAYRTEARWNKAIQHLRDAGQLTNTPKDIGGLIREVPADILKEDEQEIKDKLFKSFWPHIQRGVTRGLPEYYKDLLAKSAF